MRRIIFSLLASIALQAHGNSAWIEQNNLSAKLVVGALTPKKKHQSNP